MFRLRQSRPHPQFPTASAQDLAAPASFARHPPRSARHISTCDLDSILPPATSHASQITNSFRIRTYEKHTPNPLRIRTSKTNELRPCRMNTSEKPRGEPPMFEPSWHLTPNPFPFDLQFLAFNRQQSSSTQKWLHPTHSHQLYFNIARPNSHKPNRSQWQVIEPPLPDVTLLASTGVLGLLPQRLRRIRGG